MCVSCIKSEDLLQKDNLNNTTDQVGLSIEKKMLLHWPSVQVPLLSSSMLTSYTFPLLDFCFMLTLIHRFFCILSGRRKRG